jgi:hypothetical protein
MVVDLIREARRGAQCLDHAGIHHVHGDRGVRDERRDGAPHRLAGVGIRLVVLVRPADGLGRDRGRYVANDARHDVHACPTRDEPVKHGLQIALHPSFVPETLGGDENSHRAIGAWGMERQVRIEAASMRAPQVLSPAAVVFIAAFGLIALVTKPYVLSWNDGSRVATIDAIVHEHTFAIERTRYGARTQDKYAHGGHTYSDKPPALAVEGALVAWAIAPLGIDLDGPQAGRAIYAIVLCTVGLWFAIGSAYAYAFARALGAGVRRAVLVAALTGIGTLILPYATLLVNHVPSGAAALAGAYHLMRARGEGRHAIAAGVFLSLACAYDAAMIVLAVFALVMLWGAPLRRWLAVGLAAVPVVALQLAFNVAVSGALGPPALNQSSWSDPSSPFHRADQTLFFFRSPVDYLQYAAYVLVGAKGLISYTPLVLVAGYGFVRMYAAGGLLRRFTIAIAVTFALYFALIVAFTNDYGALDYGERRYVDLLFLLCVGLTPAFEAVRGTMGVLAVRALLVASLAAAMLGAVEPFGGAPGESGYTVALREFARLAHRAPLQAILDAAVLVVVVILVLRSWPGGRPQDFSETTVFVEGSGSHTR